MEGKKAIWWEDEREMAELIWCAAYLDRIIAPWLIEQPEQSEATSSNDQEDNRSSGSGGYRGRTRRLTGGITRRVHTEGSGKDQKNP